MADLIDRAEAAIREMAEGSNPFAVNLYRESARIVAELVLAEAVKATERACDPPECDNLGPMDWETGMRECSRGEDDCSCTERWQAGQDAAAAIKKLADSTA